MSCKQSRSFSSHGHGRSAIQAQSDPHRELTINFANQLAAVLARKLEHGRYHRLTLVAAPAILGDLRAAVSANVRPIMIGAIAHDLTKTLYPEILGHLKDLLLPASAASSALQVVSEPIAVVACAPRLAA